MRNKRTFAGKPRFAADWHRKSQPDPWVMTRGSPKHKLFQKHISYIRQCAAPNGAVFSPFGLRSKELKVSRNETVASADCSCYVFQAVVRLFLFCKTCEISAIFSVTTNTAVWTQLFLQGFSVALSISFVTLHLWCHYRELKQQLRRRLRKRQLKSEFALPHKYRISQTSPSFGER